MPARPDLRTYAAFAGTIFIGGTNFVAVSVSNAEMPPLFGAMLRFGLAAALFILIARVMRIPTVRRRDIAGAALYGLLGFGIAYALLYYALVGLSAGTVAVVLAAVPLFTVGIAVIVGQERLAMRSVVGGLLAIGGIALLSLDAIGGEVGRSYAVAAIVAVIATAASSVVAKGVTRMHPVSMNAIGMAAGTVFLFTGSLILREPWALPRNPETLIALTWLVLVGSVGLFQLFLYVIKRWTASATVYALTGMPVVAAGLGAVMLDQPITGEVLAGGVLVIAAVYVGAISVRQTPGGTRHER